MEQVKEAVPSTKLICVQSVKDVTMELSMGCLFKEIKCITCHIGAVLRVYCKNKWYKRSSPVLLSYCNSIRALLWLA